MSTIKRRVELITRLQSLGFTYDEANQLRRIEMTLHRWAELECGTDEGCIERDGEEMFSKPYFTRENPCSLSGKRIRHPIADRERGALKRLALIMFNHPAFVAYQQTDPRGCALYIVRKSDLGSLSIDANYTRGIAVAA